MDPIETARSTTSAVLKLAPPLAVLGVALVLFGAPTYADLAAGNYADAAVGVTVFLAFAAGTFWWLYRRVDAAPSVTIPSEN